MRADRFLTPAGMPVLVAAPDEAPGRACVILLHERYGLVQHTEDLARRLAAEGYAVAAPDVFYDAPDQDALHRGAAKVASDDSINRARIGEVIALLARDPRADTTRLAIIGVCQTGRVPLVIDADRPLRACAVLYGAAQDREWEQHERFPVALAELIGRGRAPVLGLFGELDHAISLAHVQRLRDACERARRSYTIAVYAGAPHGWLNDTMPGRYRAPQAAAAWAELIGFLAAHLGAASPDDTVRWRFTATTSSTYDFAKNVRLE